ncbi:ABC transporter ATP-binding protein [Granulosicoccus sp. 3-233]|uniref:ABC transporter ATP-binding protein n=1 Tax=Granulosicoccus sp. 3-233 TaxID=3417969 RepID=UPI003D33B099
MMLLQVQDLTSSFRTREGKTLRALNAVSFNLAKGEVLGIVGESGCGKSTLAKSVLRLIGVERGSVRFHGQDVMRMSKAELQRARQRMQIVFQDPFGSLNPRHTIGKIIREPLQVHGVGSAHEQQLRVVELLERVGLSGDVQTRHAHEFSGGQRQRIAIARALALQPELLVADEAVSALDVSVQSQIINLITELQAELGLSLLFISHDLSVIRHVSDRIAVMYLGRIVEIGEARAVMNQPQHPYTRALISAIPSLSTKHAQRIVLQGELPDPTDPPAGCSFQTRCPQVHEQCLRQRPELKAVVAITDNRNLQATHLSACHLNETTP